MVQMTDSILKYCCYTRLFLLYPIHSRSTIECFFLGHFRNNFHLLSHELVCVIQVHDVLSVIPGISAWFPGFPALLTKSRQPISIRSCSGPTARDVIAIRPIPDGRGRKRSLIGIIQVESGISKDGSLDLMKRKGRTENGSLIRVLTHWQPLRCFTNYHWVKAS